MESPAPSCLSLAHGPVRELTSDLLIVPATELDRLADLVDLDAAANGELSRAMASREFTGKPFELLFATLTGDTWRTRRVLLVGAGPADRWNAEMARRVATAAALAARQRHITRVALVYREALRESRLSADLLRLLQALAEGLTLGHFDMPRQRSGAADQLPAIVEASLLVPGLDAALQASAARAIERGCVLADCTNRARQWANEPSNRLTPRALADRAVEAAAGTTLIVDVLDQERIAALNMGLLQGVARGSSEPPRVIVLRHDPPGAPDRPVLGLVGKGITFDSGGISIKPADGMEKMKVDMAGGAAVIAALRAAALLQAPIKVIGVVPSTENMPGGRAIKPGDVLRGAGGATVEVVNTDAEGRLVLGDGLWYARELGATHLVDVATLTGACVVALGRVLSGVFGGPETFVEAVRAIGELTGDRCWAMPAFDEYFEQLRSDVADFTNTGGRPAGAVTAAVFLKQFTGGLPWAHLDIAGTAWADDARPFQIKGATGAATRLLAELALSPERWT
jgi:leucyl aminopeptidase